MTLRSLFIQFGFKGNLPKKLDEVEKKVTNIKKEIFILSAAFSAATAIIGKFIYEAAKIEQVEIAFETMTGSATKGKKMLEDLFQLARYTPFKIPGVIQSSRTLLGMGIETEKMNDTLIMLGDVAAGLNVPLLQLALTFGKVKAAGYLTGFELQNLRRAGVPLMMELEKILGKTRAEIMTMVRKQQVSFEIFEQAWKNLTIEGGRFHNMMIRQSSTFLGILSNISDFIQIIIIESGKELLPIAKKTANQLLNILEINKKIINLKLKSFFGEISKALEILNRGFLRTYFRTQDIINRLGGLGNVIKVLSFLLGGFLSIKTLTLLGKIAKISISFLNLSNIKLMLLGAGLILILAAIEDIFAFLDGKKSIIGEMLDALENKFPEAFKRLIVTAKILKKEIEGLSLFYVGLLSGDTKMIKYALLQLSDAHDIMFEEGKRQAGKESIVKNWVDKIPVKEVTQPAGPNAPWWKQIFLGAEGPNLWDKITGKNKEKSMIFPVSTKRDEESIYNPPEISKQRVMNFSMPIEVNFTNVPNGLTPEQMIPILKNTINTTVDKRINNMLRENWSSIESSQE